ncbi:hypothetical protein P8452_04710 [Trifolium repens]|nr:hypothetical protein P8452_04710 [Trifolium repens]
MTHYDIHFGILIMPWYQFCESAFGFAFSDLLLIICGWVDFCTTHGVVESDKVWVSDALLNQLKQTLVRAFCKEKDYSSALICTRRLETSCCRQLKINEP